jgi:uncharacterized lipoprotein NlpE involved in copper resistance
MKRTLALIAITFSLFACESKTDTKQKKEAQKTQIAKEAEEITMISYKKAVAEATLQTIVIDEKFSMALKGTISKPEALKAYNETLGDRMGRAKKFEEALGLFNQKRQAYIELMGKQAQAEAYKRLIQKELEK